MSWLIGERSRIKGQLDRCRKQFDELPAKMANLEFLLASIDVVIPMHEVKVDPTVIVGRKPRRPSPVPYGSVTRFLLKALKEAKGKPVYTTELAFRFAREQRIDLLVTSPSDLTDRIGSRLRDLVNKGLVRKHPSGKQRTPFGWSMVTDDD